MACTLVKNVRSMWILGQNLRQTARLVVVSSNQSTSFSTTSIREDKDYKLLVVGGGTGGSAISNKYAKKLGKGAVACIEPSETHYYQPIFTLIGSGYKQFDVSHKPTEWVLHQDSDWIKEKVATFDPDNNSVTTANGEKINYEFMVVALGIQLNYHKVKGLLDALSEDPRVCSNYSPKYVKKTFPAAQNIKSGNAIFTFPNTPIKCAGAPQKICYLIDDYFRRDGRRDNIKVQYNTSLPVIFGIPKYAEVLRELVKIRNIDVNYRHSLVEVDYKKGEAIFELLDEPGKTESFKYDMLHVSPPCSSPDVLVDTPLVDATGFVDVNRESLQSLKYPNVFAIGDCANLPTAKTAAAIATQSGIVEKNLDAVMKGDVPETKYDGYTSCPLVVTHNKCILAEFGYDGQIMETFPVDQTKARYSMFYLKAKLMPQLYWHMLIKGFWHGPQLLRKILHLGSSN